MLGGECHRALVTSFELSLGVAEEAEPVGVGTVAKII